MKKVYICCVLVVATLIVFMVIVGLSPAAMKPTTSFTMSSLEDPSGQSIQQQYDSLVQKEIEKSVSASAPIVYPKQISALSSKKRYHSKQFEVYDIEELNNIIDSFISTLDEEAHPSISIVRGDGFRISAIICYYGTN
jgi:hypothetical protein